MLLGGTSKLVVHRLHPHILGCSGLMLLPLSKKAPKVRKVKLFITVKAWPIVTCFSWKCPYSLTHICEWNYNFLHVQHINIYLRRQSYLCLSFLFETLCLYHSINDLLELKYSCYFGRVKYQLSCALPHSCYFEIHRIHMLYISYSIY